MTEEIVRAKGILDGAESLEEAAWKAQDFADHLRRLTGKHKLAVSPVEDDYMFIEEK